MPRYKQYAPIDHLINHDPEVWTFTKKFGDRSLRTLLQVIVNLDRTENCWKLVDNWDGVLSRKVRQTSANVRRQIGHMLAVGWLTVLEAAADGSPMVVCSPNYWKFHRRPEPKKVFSETEKNRDSVSPTLHNTKEKKLYKEKNLINGFGVSHGTVTIGANRVAATAGKYSKFE